MNMLHRLPNRGVWVSVKDGRAEFLCLRPDSMHLKRMHRVIIHGADSLQSEANDDNGGIFRVDLSTRTDARDERLCVFALLRGGGCGKPSRVARVGSHSSSSIGKLNASAAADGQRDGLDDHREVSDNDREAFDNDREAFDNDREAFDNDREAFDDDRDASDNEKTVLPGQIEQGEGVADGKRELLESHKADEDDDEGENEERIDSEAEGQDGAMSSPIGKSHVMIAKEDKEVGLIHQTTLQEVGSMEYLHHSKRQHTVFDRLESHSMVFDGMDAIEMLKEIVQSLEDLRVHVFGDQGIAKSYTTKEPVESVEVRFQDIIRNCNKATMHIASEMKMHTRENERYKQKVLDYQSILGEATADTRAQRADVDKKLIEMENKIDLLGDEIDKLKAELESAEKNHHTEKDSADESEKTIARIKYLSESIQDRERKIVELEEMSEDLRSLGYGADADLVRENQILKHYVDDLNSRFQGELERNQERSLRMEQEKNALEKAITNNESKHLEAIQALKQENANREEKLGAEIKALEEKLSQQAMRGTSENENAVLQESDHEPLSEIVESLQKRLALLEEEKEKMISQYESEIQQIRMQNENLNKDTMKIVNPDAINPSAQESYMVKATADYSNLLKHLSAMKNQSEDMEGEIMRRITNQEGTLETMMGKLSKIREHTRKLAVSQKNLIQTGGIQKLVGAGANVTKHGVKAATFDPFVVEPISGDRSESLSEDLEKSQGVRKDKSAKSNQSPKANFTEKGKKSQSGAPMQEQSHSPKDLDHHIFSNTGQDDSDDDQNSQESFGPPPPIQDEDADFVQIQDEDMQSNTLDDDQSEDQHSLDEDVQLDDHEQDEDDENEMSIESNNREIQNSKEECDDEAQSLPGEENFNKAAQNEEQEAESDVDEEEEEEGDLHSQASSGRNIEESQDGDDDTKSLSEEAKLKNIAKNEEHEVKLQLDKQDENEEEGNEEEEEEEENEEEGDEEEEEEEEDEEQLPIQGSNRRSVEQSQDGGDDETQLMPESEEKLNESTSDEDQVEPELDNQPDKVEGDHNLRTQESENQVIKETQDHDGGEDEADQSRSDGDPEHQENNEKESSTDDDNRDEEDKEDEGLMPLQRDKASPKQSQDGSGDERESLPDEELKLNESVSNGEQEVKPDQDESEDGLLLNSRHSDKDKLQDSKEEEIGDIESQPDAKVPVFQQIDRNKELKGLDLTPSTESLQGILQVRQEEEKEKKKKEKKQSHGKKEPPMKESLQDEEQANKEFIQSQRQQGQNIGRKVSLGERKKEKAVANQAKQKEIPSVFAGEEGKESLQDPMIDRDQEVMDDPSPNMDVSKGKRKIVKGKKDRLENMVSDPDTEKSLKIKELTPLKPKLNGESSSSNAKEDSKVNQQENHQRELSQEKVGEQKIRKEVQSIQNANQAEKISANEEHVVRGLSQISDKESTKKVHSTERKPVLGKIHQLQKELQAESGQMDPVYEKGQRKLVENPKETHSKDTKKKKDSKKRDYDQQEDHSPIPKQTELVASDDIEEENSIDFASNESPNDTEVRQTSTPSPNGGVDANAKEDDQARGLAEDAKLSKKLTAQKKQGTKVKESQDFVTLNKGGQGNPEEQDQGKKDTVLKEDPGGSQVTKKKSKSGFTDESSKTKPSQAGIESQREKATRKEAPSINTRISQVSMASGKIRDQPHESVIKSRCIRVFLSTAPDVLLSSGRATLLHLQPRLEKFARAHGWNVEFINLGWCNSSKEAIHWKAIERYLKEATECTYFIGLLGNRYGYCPNSRDPNAWSSDLYNSQTWLKSYVGKSLFEMGIRGSVFTKVSYTVRAFFYLCEGSRPHTKERESPGASSMLGTLKKDIESVCNIHRYSQEPEVAEKLLGDIQDAIKKDFISISKSPDTETSKHEMYAASKLRAFCGRENELDQIVQEVTRNGKAKNQPFVVYGSPGIGKSSLMAKAQNELEARSHIVLSHFIGSSTNSFYSNKLVSNLCLQLYHKMGLIKDAVDIEDIENESQEKGFSVITALVDSPEHQKSSFVVLIDGVELLLPKNLKEKPHLLQWIPFSTPRNLKIILSMEYTEGKRRPSSYEELSPFQIVRQNDWKTIKLSPMIREDVAKILSKRCDQLPDRLLAEMVDCVEGRSSVCYPFHLCMLLNALAYHEEQSTIATKFAELLHISSSKDLFRSIYHGLQEKYGEGLTDKIFQIICTSRFGVEESALREFAIQEHQIRVEDWERFFSRISADFLYLIDNRYQLCHTNYKVILEESFDKMAAMQAYVRYLDRQYSEKDDSTTEIVADMCNSLYVAKDYSALERYLSKAHVAEAMLGSSFKFEFCDYWLTLNKNGYNHQKTYFSMMQESNPLATRLIDYFKFKNEEAFLITVLKGRIKKRKVSGENIDDWKQLGKIYLQSEEQSVLVKGLECFHNILVAKSEEDSEENLELAEIHELIGKTNSRLKRFEPALMDYKNSLRIRKILQGNEHQDVATVHHMIATVYEKLKRFDNAIAEATTSLRIRVQVFGEQHLSVAASYVVLAGIYKATKQQQKALDMLKKARDIYEQINGADDAKTIEVEKRIAQLKEKKK